MDNLVNEIPEIPELLIYKIPIDNSIQPELTPEFLEFINNTNINNLRNQRNQLLKESDKYLLPDFPITTENLELVKIYRQQLRDYMDLAEVKSYNSSNNFPLPDFPDKPTFI
jgi:hypothetical protein